MRKILALTFAILMTLAAAVPAAFASYWTREGTATIFVGKSQYKPGEVIAVRGDGWEPLESVTLTLQKERDGVVVGEVVVYTFATAEGTVSHSGLSPAEGDINMYYTLVAKGGTSERLAATNFTD